MVLTAQLNFSVLNPSVRFTWIKQQWDTNYIQNAKGIILELVSTMYYFSHISAITCTHELQDNPLHVLNIVGIPLRFDPCEAYGGIEDSKVKLSGQNHNSAI